jgi:DNA-binding IclR family transcriptional regulator
MPRTSSKPKSDYAIQTVSNALRMLEVFHNEAEIGVSELARKLDLHKNNAFRLLATLEQGGYIQQSRETELYSLGPRCLELGVAFSRSHPLMRQARPILEELAARFGETSHLGVLDDQEVVHLDGILPAQLVLTGLRVGERLPAHCTALGKMLLASSLDSGAEGDEAAEAARPFQVEGPLERYTDATIPDSTKLADELRAVRLRGYAVDRQEYAEGLCCVAAPLRGTSGRVTAALSLSGPSFRMSEEVLHGEVAKAITAAAAELSQQLGSPVS